MKFTISLIILIFLSLTIQAQSITVIDDNLDNDWPLFRDRILGASSESVLFRMSESSDLNLYHSDGTNGGTVITGYTFVTGFSGSDVEFVTQKDDDIVLGVTGASNDILLFKDNSSEMIMIASGLNDLEGIVIIGRNVYYAASKSQSKSNKIFKYNIDTGSEEELFTFDNSGVIAISLFKGEILAMGYKNGANHLMTIDTITGEHSSFYTFTSNPSFPKRVNMTNSGNKVYFWFKNGNSEYSLYVTDGTEEGTLILVDDLDYYDSFSYSTNNYIIGENGTLVFRGITQAQNSSNGDIYFTDGTIENTRLLNINGETNVKPYDFIYHEGVYYFIAVTSDGSRLCKSDGSQDGTVVLSDKDALGLEFYNGKLFMGAEFDGFGIELGYWDTFNSTIELAYDIEQGFKNSRPRQLTATDRKLFLVTSDDPFNRLLMVYQEDLFSSINKLNDYSIKISPNPVLDFLELKGDDNIKKVYLYDLCGNLRLETKKTRLNLSNLEAGSFILKAVNSEGESVTRIIVKL